MKTAIPHLHRTEDGARADARDDVHADPATDIRMGSEYATARAYLARVPRDPVVRRKPKSEPQHGSNDSDFGFADQEPA